MPVRPSVSPSPLGRLNIIFAGIAVFLILSGTALFLSYRHYQEVTAQSLKEDRASAQLISLIIEEHLQRIVKTMESYANRPLLVRAVKDRDVAKTKVHLISLVKSDTDTDILIVTDKEGTLWTAFPERPEVMGRNFAYREWYQTIGKTWRPHISNVVFRVVAERDTAFQICVPVFDGAGNVIGIILNTQRTAGFAKLLRPLSLDPGTFVHITDRAGNLVYSSRFAYAKKITPFPFYFVKEKVVSAKISAIPIEDPFLKGRTRYVTYTPVAGIGWSVFIGRDSGGILMAGRSYYLKTAAIAGLLFIVSTGALVYFRRRATVEWAMEQVRAAEALRVSESNYRNIFENATEGIFQSTPEGRYVTVNQAFAKIGGFDSPAEMIDAVTDIQKTMYVHPSDRARLLELLGKQDQINHFEAEIRRRDNIVIWISMNVRVVRDQGGGIRYLEGTVNDITERKRAEEEIRRLNETLERQVAELQETRYYLESLIGYANAPIIVWNPDLRITRFNHAFEKLTGSKAAEVIGEELSFLFPDASREASLRHIRQTTAGARWEVVEIPIRNREGGVRTVLWNSANIFDPDRGDVIATIAQGQDITERKRAEEAIRTLNEDLERRVTERTADLEAFSYSVSHDLRAPLRSINGFAQALQDYYEAALDDRGKHYLERIVRTTQNMGQLIDDLLKLSRVSRADFHDREIDLSAMVRSILDECRKENPERAVEIVIREGVKVRGDPQLLKIAMVNLLDNAWKFTGRNTRARIEFGVTTDSGERVCFIRDSGCGFDMAYVEKLFGVFERLHSAAEFPGTGIGLATVQRVIRRHHGHIRAEGEIGKGATFYFTLPE